MTLTFNEAMQKAERIAHDDLKDVLSHPYDRILDGSFIEEECYWLFFPRTDLEYQPINPTQIGGLLHRASAYVVSKLCGEVRFGYDLRSDPIKLKQHLDSLNSYFEAKHKKA